MSRRRGDEDGYLLDLILGGLRRCGGCPDCAGREVGVDPGHIRRVVGLMREAAELAGKRPISDETILRVRDTWGRLGSRRAACDDLGITVARFNNVRAAGAARGLWPKGGQP